MLLFSSVYEYAEAEEVISRSRFIAHVSPVADYEDAQRFVNEIKEKHKTATHNVPAIITGNKQEVQWASDNGEPQGTAGQPVLKVAVEGGLTNLAIVVTRYFGGTKLGTGGLVRAYSGVAKLGIEAAGICDVRECSIFRYRIEYPYLAKIENIAKEKGYEIRSLEYTQNVEFDLVTDSDYSEEAKQSMLDLTSGKALLLETKIEPVRIKKH
jgi:uncharacterized YigZ family protein